MYVPRSGSRSGRKKSGRQATCREQPPKRLQVWRCAFFTELRRYEMCCANSGAMSAARSRQLFCVNWADSRPGVCWQEMYEATYLPLRDRYIVTATQETSDAYGPTDQAIGHFPASVPVREGIRAVIVAYWMEYYAWSEYGWEALEDEGFVGATTVEAMRDEVWSARSDYHETYLE